VDTLNFAANMDLVGLQVMKGDGNTVRAKLEMKITDTEALGFFGEDFKRLAFGDMQIVKLDEDEGGDVEPRFGIQKKIINADLDHHVINLLGNESTVRPRILSIIPIKGERAVRLCVAVSFIANEASRPFIGELAQKFAQQFRVTFKPAQGQLPLNGSAEDSSEDDDDEGGEEAPAVEAPGKRRGVRVVKDADGAPQH
jgi:hypothetical protein